MVLEIALRIALRPLRFGADELDAIEVVGAGPRAAAWLGIAHRRPLLAITRITHDAEGRPFEYAYDLFRADRVRLTATATTVTARECFGTDGRVERSVAGAQTIAANLSASRST